MQPEKIVCKVCKKVFECPPLRFDDIANGEELPDVCQECPYPDESF